jgi:hypothetical protein
MMQFFTCFRSQSIAEACTANDISVVLEEVYHLLGSVYLAVLELALDKGNTFIANCHILVDPFRPFLADIVDKLGEFLLPLPEGHDVTFDATQHSAPTRSVQLTRLLIQERHPLPPVCFPRQLNLVEVVLSASTQLESEELFHPGVPIPDRVLASQLVVIVELSEPFPAHLQAHVQGAFAEVE